MMISDRVLRRLFIAATAKIPTSRTVPKAKCNFYDNRTAPSIRNFSSSLDLADTRNEIGFIGLGNMGLPMCSNLAIKNPNSKIVVFDVNEKAIETISNTSTSNVKNNVIVASSINEIASSMDISIIFTMLPGCDAVNDVMSALFKKRQGDPKTIFVDCSTVSPTTSRYWNEKVSKYGHILIDAPVSGGVKGAKDGTLSFMVGNGDNATKMDSQSLYTEYKIESYLKSMGSKIIHCGDSGTGAATKLCNNLALACQMIGICEAMNLGESLGVNPVDLANVMNASTAKCWSGEINNPHPIVASLANSPASKNYQGGFSTKLMLKDLSLAILSAQQLSSQSTTTYKKVALPLGTLSKELYQMADNNGYGHLDFGVMLQFLKGGSKETEKK